MSLEDFQLLDNEPFDKSIIRRDLSSTRSSAQSIRSEYRIYFGRE